MACFLIALCLNIDILTYPLLTLTHSLSLLLAPKSVI